MFETDYCEFEPYHNSFLCTTTIPEDSDTGHLNYTKCTTPELLNNLSSISALYLYTGVPPLAYGSQGPKVAETVLRAYGYNKNEEKSDKIQHLEVESLHWKGDIQDFPLNEVHGNYIVGAAYSMACEFLKINCAAIDQVADQTIDFFMNHNSDLLTKGRQSGCSITNRSVPAATAFKTMYDFLKENTGETIFSGLEWIRAYCKLFQLSEIKGTIENEKIRIIHRYDKESKQRCRTKQVSRKMEPHTYTEESEKINYVLFIATTFESYLKSMERAHKDRRAIASANMILRMFLAIIEEFHLSLGKVIDGSTISIGGEQKKQKITATLNGATITSTSRSCSIQGTEDATKWNECLSPSLFALMHKTFFDIDTRNKLGLPLPTPNGVLFSRIAITGNFLMSIKKIKLGPGPVGYKNNIYNRIPWTIENLGRFNAKTQDWFSKCEGKLVGNFLQASPGMLMGMLNAGSTTVGLLASNFNMEKSRQKVVTLRSSDDSMSVYVGDGWNNVKECVSKHRTNLEMISINLSTKKTLFFPTKYGEYTSWYQDGNFVSQYGVETAAIRPQGQNPPDDFHSVAKGVTVALQTLTINPLGATIRLKLGIDGVRRLWRIERNPNKREGVSPEVILLSDGGVRPWCFANAHLEETAVREHFAKTETDNNYLMRVRNPNNPFNKDPEQDVVFSKERGQLVIEQIEIPRTAFHFIKRSNRTIRTENRKEVVMKEENNAEALKIIRTALPYTYVKNPTSNSSIASNVMAFIALTQRNLELTPEEMNEIERAKDFLTNGKPEAEDDESDFDDIMDEL